MIFMYFNNLYSFFPMKNKNLLLSSFFSFKQIFFSNLWVILRDLVFLYQNFFHWNISKLLIALWAFSLALIFSLPFVILWAILMFLDPIHWRELLLWIFAGKSLWFELIAWVLLSPFFLFFEILTFLVALFWAILWYNYAIYLKSRLYTSYHKREKMSFLQNHYFHRKAMLSFFRIFFWNLWYLSIPFFLFLLIAWVFFIIFQTGLFSFQIFSYISFSLFIWAIGVSFYIWFRVVFSYIELAHTQDFSLSPRHYIRESVDKTKWSAAFLYFLLIFFLFGLVMFPFTFLWQSIDSKLTEIQDYISLNLKTQTDIPEEEVFYREYLQEQYGAMSPWELQNKNRVFQLNQFFYTIMSMLFLQWLSFQILVSYYFLFCKWEKKSKKSLFFKWVLWKF